MTEMVHGYNQVFWVALYVLLWDIPKNSSLSMTLLRRTSGPRERIAVEVWCKL